MKFFTKNIVYFIIAVVIYSASNISWHGDKWKSIIQFDGKGYYSYLPAIFIYHDLQYGFFDEVGKKYYSCNECADYREKINDRVVNKFFAGTAVAMLPFFSIAHAISLITGEQADGFSFWYAIMVHLSTIFYLLVALLFLKKLLALYNVNEKNIALILITFVFGTNAFYYTLSEPSISHIYSFAFITGFLFFIKKYFTGFDLKNLIYGSALLGMIILIRPVNAVIVTAIPFMAGNMETLRNGIKNVFEKYLHLTLCTLIALCIVSIQLILYKIQSGKFIVYSYNEEGFNWMNPQINNFLFSYKKGLFVYVPILLATIVFGLWRNIFKNRYQLFTFLLIFFSATYIFSSWWNWYYGGSFGQRVFIEFYSLFALLAGFALNEEKKYLKRIYVAICFACIILCQIQTYQYRYGIIHWQEMNKEKYWDVFLKIN